jgi:hypothetical protein
MTSATTDYIKKLNYKEISIEQFTLESEKNPGNIIHISRFSLHTNSENQTTSYYTLCFKFSDGYYAANKISFKNQLVASSAIPSKNKNKVTGKEEVEFCQIFLRKLKKEEIMVGDYSMPNMESIPENKREEIKEKYYKSVDQLYNANADLDKFLHRLNFEWEAFGAKMTKGYTDEFGNAIDPCLKSREFPLPLAKTEVSEIQGSRKVQRTLETPLYKCKIPVVKIKNAPKKMTKDKSGKEIEVEEDKNPETEEIKRIHEKYVGRIGYIKNKEFVPVLFDFDGSKNNIKAGKPSYVEAKLAIPIETQVDNKHVITYRHEDLTYHNVGDYLTYLSKITGNIDISNANHSMFGLACRMVAKHLIVKPFKRVKKSDETSKDLFNLAIQEDQMGDFDQYRIPVESKEPETLSNDMLDELSKIPIDNDPTTNNAEKIKAFISSMETAKDPEDESHLDD